MRVFAVIIIVVLAGAASVTAMRISEQRAFEREAAALTGGNPHRGREQMRGLGCVACHAVPGIPGVRAHVGPPLDQFALRHFVAGVAENTPDNLLRFLQDPRAVAPRSAMPKLNLSEADARDLAAFLYTLR